jgi:hypothetical protein
MAARHDMIRSGVSLSQEIVPIDENTVANARIRNLVVTAAADSERVMGNSSAALDEGGVQGGAGAGFETPDTRC